MDSKFVWIASRYTRVYVLSVIDTFTRFVLAWHVGMSITRHTVKEVIFKVIVNHLQKTCCAQQRPRY